VNVAGESAREAAQSRQHLYDLAADLFTHIYGCAGRFLPGKIVPARIV
jgi:hypothetical protein